MKTVFKTDPKSMNEVVYIESINEVLEQSDYEYRIKNPLKAYRDGFFPEEINNKIEKLAGEKMKRPWLYKTN